MGLVSGSSFRLLPGLQPFLSTARASARLLVQPSLRPGCPRAHPSFSPAQTPGGRQEGLPVPCTPPPKDSALREGPAGGRAHLEQARPVSSPRGASPSPSSAQGLLSAPPGPQQDA